jgi:2-oxo-3-hexenedioate decarboxylase
MANQNGALLRAKALWQAQAQGKTIARFSAKEKISLEEGYLVQDEVRRLHLDSGSRLVGRKMGMTSRPKMLQMGLKAPIQGFLTDQMEVEEGGVMPWKNRVQAKVEPEIAFLMDQPLSGKVKAREAQAALGAVMGALEIIDSRFTNYDFQLPDVVADNCSAAGFVLGPLKRLARNLDLTNLGIILSVSGEPSQFGSSAAILGDPLLSLVSLVHLLDERGESLEAGSIVLAGGATAALALKPGAMVVGEFSMLGKVKFSVEANG